MRNNIISVKTWLHGILINRPHVTTLSNVFTNSCFGIWPLSVVGNTFICYWWWWLYTKSSVLKGFDEIWLWKWISWINGKHKIYFLIITFEPHGVLLVRVSGHISRFRHLSWDERSSILSSLPTEWLERSWLLSKHRLHVAHVSPTRVLGYIVSHRYESSMG